MHSVWSNEGAPATLKSVATPATVPVWDPFLRLFHWSLAAAIGVALVTSLVLPPTWVRLHIVSGTTGVALVVARIVWGFFGPTYARFASFVRGPTALIDHAKHLRKGGARHHIGHNPLGGAMIVAQIAAVLALGLTGTIALGGVLKSGPLAFLANFAAGNAARELHQAIGWGLVDLIVLHLGGVVFESLRGGENLVAAMVHGRKRARAAAVAASRHVAHPLRAVAIIFPLFLASGVAVEALSSRPPPGVPTVALDPIYASECGDCHAPYHPNLAPAAAWTAIMDHLDRHFGEDASVDAATVARIRSYLVANAADTADTKPANVFRRRDVSDPLRITATPFWRRTHAGIPDPVFASKAVGSRANCGACHQDAATGLFSPFSIAVAKDTAS